MTYLVSHKDNKGSILEGYFEVEAASAIEAVQHHTTWNAEMKGTDAVAANPEGSDFWEAFKK